MKALLIIDMQMEMQRRIAAGFECVNADAPERIDLLTTLFRGNKLPVLHVRHRNDAAGSPFAVDAAGYTPMACSKAAAGEPVFVKTTSSAFASTDLTEYARGIGITELVVVGAVAGFCVNSTVRSGSDLGFKMTVVRDAVIGFGLPKAELSAQAVFDVTMGLLAADFAEMIVARDVSPL